MTIPLDFIDWVRREVEEYQLRFQTIKTDRHAFASWALGFIHELDDDEAFNQTDTLTQGDLGCDGYHAATDDDEFFICQAKYPDDPTGTELDSTSINEVVYAYNALLNPAALEERNRKLAEIGSGLVDAISGGAQPVLQCIVFSKFSKNAVREKDVIEPSLTHGARIELIGLEDLYALHLERESSGDLKGQEITLELFAAKTIPAEVPECLTGIEGAVVCNLDAFSLAKVVANYHPEIFDKNVRAHLGHGNRVNKRIRKLLESKDKRSAFWFYNNGLTIICDSFTVDETEKKLRVTNPQIVNGCQTASALSDKRAHFRTRNDRFPVLAKITCVTEDEAGRDQMLQIAENTNSQSPVAVSDLKSNTPNQVELQVSFSRLPRPWFYERKRGEWNSLSRAERDRYQTRKVTMVTVGQRWLAYNGNPADSVANKESLFTDPTRYGEVYDPSRDPRYFLLAHRVYEEFNSLLSSDQRERRVELAGVDFDNAYLNRILRGKSLWISHMVCLAREILKTIYGDFSAETAGQFITKLESESKSFNPLWKILIYTFKQWCDTLEEGSDLRSELKKSDTITSLFRKLSDHILTLPEWTAYELPIQIATIERR